MPAKRKLSVKNDYAFFLFGISCPEKIYRLCWALNIQFRAKFTKEKDVEIYEKNSLMGRFPVFWYHNEEMFTDYRIIINKTGNKFLVPEFRQADYLLFVQGCVPSVEKISVLKKLKEITFVQAVFEINPEKIKSRDNFLF